MSTARTIWLNHLPILLHCERTIAAGATSSRAPSGRRKIAGLIREPDGDGSPPNRQGTAVIAPVSRRQGAAGCRSTPPGGEAFRRTAQQRSQRGSPSPPGHELGDEASFGDSHVAVFGDVGGRDAARAQVTHHHSVALDNGRWADEAFQLQRVVEDAVRGEEVCESLRVQLLPGAADRPNCLGGAASKLDTLFFPIHPA